MREGIGLRAGKVPGLGYHPALPLARIADGVVAEAASAKAKRVSTAAEKVTLERGASPALCSGICRIPSHGACGHKALHLCDYALGMCQLLRQPDAYTMGVGLQVCTLEMGLRGVQVQGEYTFTLPC